MHGAVNHLYLYDEITPMSINELRSNVRKLNAAAQSRDVNNVHVETKPIVVHINSVGGDYFTSLTFLCIFNESILPICAMIDGVSYSAATNLSLFAPYRIMTHHAMVLIHQWSVKYSHRHITKDELLFDIGNTSRLDSSLEQLVLQRTKFNKEQLSGIMSRDMYLDSDFCMKMGIVDRVISNNVTFTKTPKQRLDFIDMIRNVHNNHVYLNFNQITNHSDNENEIHALKTELSAIKAGQSTCTGSAPPVYNHTSDAFKAISDHTNNAFKAISDVLATERMYLQRDMRYFSKEFKSIDEQTKW